jgi:NADH-quinone oxidoreductase subunit J
MAAEMGLLLASRYAGFTGQPMTLPAGVGNTKMLGRLIYTDYVYAFEIAAVILLVAIVAAIALTLRGRKDTRRQDPSAQLRVRREDRVRLVSMPSERDE